MALRWPMHYAAFRQAFCDVGLPLGSVGAVVTEGALCDVGLPIVVGGRGSGDMRGIV